MRDEKRLSPRPLHFARRQKPSEGARQKPVRDPKITVPNGFPLGANH